MALAFSTRVAYAFRSFFGLLLNGELPEDIVRACTGKIVTGSPVKPAIEKIGEQTSDRAVQMIALLQRDGRLVDFLTEDVSPYPDSQLGAAVRTIHSSCREVLNRYLQLEPIIASEEDQPVTVQPDFDPAAIKLIGNVVGKPPFKGLLRHRGWRVKQASLPALPQDAARNIVAPAEVEMV